MICSRPKANHLLVQRLLSSHGVSSKYGHSLTFCRDPADRQAAYAHMFFRIRDPKYDRDHSQKQSVLSRPYTGATRRIVYNGESAGHTIRAQIELDSTTTPFDSGRKQRSRQFQLDLNFTRSAQTNAIFLIFWTNIRIL